MHLLRAMHRQGDLAALAARDCALHHQTLCGESLEPEGRRTTAPDNGLCVLKEHLCRARRRSRAACLLAHRLALTVLMLQSLPHFTQV